MTINIIMPLPSRDFDPTEVSVSWKVMIDAGLKVGFATVDGQRGYCDSRMISGEGLDPWGWIPLLKKIRLFGLLLRANRAARTDDGMLLAGGHASGMKQYLEDQTLQGFVADFFDHVDAKGQNKPVAAVCHGVILAARSKSKITHKSVLYGKKTTALTWALEKSAWHLTKYFARFWDPTYYRTYIESKGESSGYWSVESEVKRALKSDADFQDVPKSADDYRLKTSGIARDSLNDGRAAWVVVDGNYISARWPGDVHTMAKQFVDKMKR